MKGENLYRSVRRTMELFFGPDSRRIAHAVEVTEHALRIQAVEGGERDIVIMAGLLHDVGIKPGEERYGRSDGKIQETLGPPVAEEMLEPLGVKPEKIARVKELIAHHHTPGRITTREFSCLWDADMIVNLREVAGGMSRQKTGALIEAKFLTGEGKRIAWEIFLAPPSGENGS